MDLTLNPATGRWELLESGRCAFSFQWDGPLAEYVSDRGEHLGRVWADALKDARQRAEERSNPKKGRR